MTEQKVKKRGWIKNAVIIFLAILLVLTFFSNTIMNWSLPEVAAQYVNSGTITTRVRGSGTVTANETYQVSINETRTIQSVAVKVGDTVEPGDLLFTLADSESTELEETQTALDDLELAYQKAVINATTADYAKENRDIQNARAALEEAQATLNGMTDVTDADLAAAKEAVNEAEDRLVVLQAERDTAQTNLDALGGRDEGTSGDYSQVTAAQNALTAARNELAAAVLAYGNNYLQLAEEVIEGRIREVCTKLNINSDDLSGDLQTLIELEAKLELARYNQTAGTSNAVSNAETAISDFIKDRENIKKVQEEYKKTWQGKIATYISAAAMQIGEGDGVGRMELKTAYETLEERKSAVSSAQTAYDQALREYNNSSSSGNAAQYDRLKAILDAAIAAYNSGNTRLTQLQSALEDLQTQKTEYATAKEAVRTAQTTLEDMIFALQDQQVADGKTQATEALDLQAQRDQIAELQQKLQTLQANGVGGTVTSQVSGVVKTIDITAGNQTEPTATLATIEVPDRGYSLSFSVTQEQARRVRVGDTAEVSNYYYGGDITATVTGITNDPENPTQNRLVVFSISGDVETGTQLTLSVGTQSANYDTIVPNSAIRSDSNGSFVLVVEAKSSPLGNRYIATRVDVQILAQDDTNAAVSGGLAANDYVITTSTHPLEAGMQVRMVESTL